MERPLIDRLYEVGLTPDEEYAVRCAAATEIERLRNVPERAARIVEDQLFTEQPWLCGIIANKIRKID